MSETITFICFVVETTKEISLNHRAVLVKSDSIVDLMYNAAIHIYRLGSAADIACDTLQSLLLRHCL